MGNSFYSEAEVKELGLASFGKNVLISRKASIYRPEAISLGDNVRIDDFCILSGGKGIQIGDFVHIAPFCGLYGGGGIDIRDFVGISSRCALYSETDDYSGNSLTNPTIPIEFKPSFVSKKIVLQKHALIGSNSTILPGVTLNEGAACGANSLITKDCEEWSIYFGSPAKRLKARRKNLLQLEAKLRLIM